MTDLDGASPKPFPSLGAPDAEGRLVDTGNLLESTDGVAGFLPFRRWVKSFREKRYYPRQNGQRYVEGWSDASSNRGENALNLATQELQWEAVSRHSSHLGTVKTNTMSIASQSVMRSRGATQSTTNYSSAKSEVRQSTESARPVSWVMDEEAHNRALKRRRALQEIIVTESDYILLLFSTRLEIYHNLQLIRGIHDAFLNRIRTLTPMSCLPGMELDQAISNKVPKHPNAVDLSFKAFQNRSSRTRNPNTRLNLRIKAVTAETSEVLEVAREIDKLSTSFVVYRDFCSHYEQLTQDMDLLRRSAPNWPILDQGIEALSKSVASMESRTLEPNKSMSLNDLLIKPIQRLCKYPLLLQELLKWTHIQDDPSAHDGIREILEGVRATVAQINEAPSNPINKRLTHQTLLLQDMLDLPKQTTVHNVYRQLGPIGLCGVLHVTYQTSNHLTGGYMVCVLFKNHFLLARVHDDFRRLQAVMCLYTSDVKIDTPRNGQGLSCHKCYFSWKLVFHHEDKRFEIVLSASSANEEKLWKTGLLKSVATSADVQRPVSSEQSKYCFLSLDLQPLDSPCYPEAFIVGRSPIHPLSFPRTESNLQHVIIKKTHCPHKLGTADVESEGVTERPKTPSLPPLVLTSRRQERVRLERVISPIYTRDSLPYPGMILTKGDILFGSGSVMRRLSLRPGIHRRSSSAHLPSRRMNEEHHEKEETPDHSRRGEMTQRKSEYDLERGRILPGYNFGTIGRSKTLRRKSSSKQPSSPDSQICISKGEGSHESLESPSVKSSIRTIFNSMSLRRARRNPRMGLAGGGG
ncbi:Dbl homology domain-containing protein [Aspergillus steynii IBT 23096]|uniref:Dbl homology domain-containing protein n=1 Tax=Aspergillus steynii IBT 23096 TaxID=1392250 RepID=A0A2I2GBA2_9EURO|nr:Dbl homology domain-containing protein [Aspergillus steynii IBT 23096]PLB50127.1 Dbl homology domain-containing protein [Aspergillus steynii IBT 23096]